jgi:hypothetical protein
MMGHLLPGKYESKIKKYSLKAKDAITAYAKKRSDKK